MLKKNKKKGERAIHCFDVNDAKTIFARLLSVCIFEA
jgi:hypothetical protein